ncbi:MAG: Nramp family divalent metal transporter [Ignavibacteriaceae bacterium]
MKKIYKKILLFLVSIGPGLFLVGYNIGTGSVTTMASAGAAYGMTLTWTVLLSCIFTFVLIIAFSRYTLVTGKTALYSFKENFGVVPAGFVLIIIIFSEMVSSVGLMAVICESVQEWSRPLTSTGEGFNTIILAAFFAVIALTLLFMGRYTFIEKILTVFVMLMGLSFILTNFMVVPDAGAVIKGLIPTIPNEANASVLIAGMVGTTMGGVLYIARSITIKEKGWTIRDMKLEKRDALISASLMFILSIAVMFAAAGTLYPLGLRIDNAIDMIKTLQPLAGRFAISIFVVGIVSAGLSSLFPHYMLVPLLLSDFLNEKLELSKPRNKAIMIFYASLGLVVPIFGGRPVLVMIVSQAVTLIITPLVLIFMVILMNKKDLMGKYKPSPLVNIVYVIITIFTVYLSYIGAVGIFQM